MLRLVTLLINLCIYQSFWINATFHNNYNNNAEYLFCKVYGGENIGHINDILYPNNKQSFLFNAYNEINILSGNCYYKVLNEYNVRDILDILFYRSVFGHEHYGLSNSPYYKVKIDIKSIGHPMYYIYT